LCRFAGVGPGDCFRDDTKRERSAGSSCAVAEVAGDTKSEHTVAGVVDRDRDRADRTEAGDMDGVIITLPVKQNTAFQ